MQLRFVRPARSANRIHPDRPRAHGFTLIEVMVVIVILGVLAALVVPRIMSRPDEARVVAARQDIASLMQALKLYKLDNRRYPSTEQGLGALVVRPHRRTGTGELEGLRRAPARGPLGPALPVPGAGRAWRSRCVQLRRRRPPGRRRLRRRHRLLAALSTAPASPRIASPCSAASPSSNCWSCW